MYINEQDLIERFGEREIRQLVQSIDDNAIVSAIQDASVEVDGYVARQYSLPLPYVTNSLKRATAIIARYYLHKERASDKVRQDYEDVIKWLDKVAKGQIFLVFDAPKPANDFVSGAFVV